MILIATLAMLSLWAAFILIFDPELRGETPTPFQVRASRIQIPESSKAASCVKPATATPIHALIRESTPSFAEKVGSIPVHLPLPGQSTARLRLELLG